MPIIKDPIAYAAEQAARLEELLIAQITEEWIEREGVYHGRTLTPMVMRRLLGRRSLPVSAVTLGARLRARGWVRGSGMMAWYFTEEFVDELNRRAAAAAEAAGCGDGA